MAPMILHNNHHNELQLTVEDDISNNIPPAKPLPPITQIDQKNGSGSPLKIARPKMLGRGLTCRPSIDTSKVNSSQMMVPGKGSIDLNAMSPSSVVETISESTITSPSGAIPRAQPIVKHKRSRSFSFGVVPRASSNCLKSLHSKLAFRRNKYGDTHPSVGVLWNQIGNFHIRACQYDDALGAYKQAVQCDAGDHLAAAYANIGTVYWSTGEVEKSVSFLNKALDTYEFEDISEGRNPDESMKIAEVSYQIGLAQILNHKFDKAMRILERAQRIQVCVYGNSSLALARTLDAIGTNYRLQGNFFEAMNHHERALHMKEKFADDQNAIIASMSNIAAVHYSGQNFKEALLMYSRVLLKQKEILNQCKHAQKQRDQLVRASTDVGQTLQILGDIYTLLNDKQEAKKCFNESALVYQEAGLKNNNPYY